jgi:hypothetical protein
MYASKPIKVTTMNFRDGHVSTMETKNAHNGLYGKLLENGHLEHRDRNVNPLKRSGYCEVDCV